MVKLLLSYVRTKLSIIHRVPFYSVKISLSTKALFLKICFLFAWLKLGWNLTISTSSNQVKPEFSKFTFKSSWLENYVVKACLKITKSYKLLNFGLKIVYFLVRGASFPSKKVPNCAKQKQESAMSEMKLRFSTKKLTSRWDEEKFSCILYQSVEDWLTYSERFSILHDIFLAKQGSRSQLKYI